MRSALALVATGLLPLLAGCRPARPERPAPSRELQVVVGPLDPARLLEGDVTRARAAGAGTLLPIGAALVAEGDQLGSFVLAAPDECVVALARAGSSLRDVDLFAFSDAGDCLAADESPEPSAAVMVCPPHPRRLYVAARVMSGTGLLALGALPVPLDKAEAVAAAVRVRGRRGEDTGKLAAWPGLEAKIRTRHTELGSSWEDVRRLALPLDSRAFSAVSVAVPAERCLDVLATPAPEASGIDLQVVDDAGRVVARARPPGRDRAVVVCSSVERLVTVMIRPRLAGGVVAVVIARSPVGAASEIGSKTWIDAAAPIGPLAASIARSHQQLSGLSLRAPVPAGEAAARPGAAATLALTLAPGCTRVEVVGGTPLGAFTATLRREDGWLLDAARGGESAALFACSRGRLRASVEVEAVDRAGPFAVETRLAPTPPELLLGHPLAAARLLQRLEAAVGPVEPAHAAAVEAIRIEAGAAYERPVTLVGGSCTRFVVALDAAAGGVMVDLVDAGGEPLDRATGVEVASVRSCRGDGAGRLRVRVAAGPANVLLLRQ